MSEESKVIEAAREEMKRACVSLMDHNNPFEVMFGAHLCNTRMSFDFLLRCTSRSDVAYAVERLRKHELDFITALCELHGLSVESAKKLAEGMHGHAMMIRADVRAADAEVPTDMDPLLKHILQKGKPHE